MGNYDLLIVSNGGMYLDDKNHASCPRDDASIVSELGENGLSVVYCSHYTRSLNAGNSRVRLASKFIALRGFKLKWAYLGVLRLLLAILQSKNVYIYYWGGVTPWAVKICKFLHKDYDIYVRGCGYERGQREGKTYQDVWMIEGARTIVAISSQICVDLCFVNKHIDVIKPVMPWGGMSIYERSFENWSSDHWIFLFVGSLIELKGIDDLVKTANILDASGMSFRLIVAGGGRMLDSLRAKQAEGQISKKVEFIGHVIDKSAIQSLYRKSDAFIFTTRSEGFGRVLLEAMSQSLPIFTTMVGGIPGFMKNEYNCLEIPVYDSAGQAEIIRKSIGDKALMAKIAANGLKTLADVQSKYPSHVDLLLIKYNESQAISKHS